MLKLSRFDPGEPDQKYDIRLSGWHCKIGEYPLNVIVYWDKDEVILNSTLFQQQALDLKEYTNADGVDFKQWIEIKINDIIRTRE